MSDPSPVGPNERIRISVIVTTYNRPDALGLVLDSLLNQNDPNYEIIVADDGSGEPTRQVVAQRQARASVRLEHVWQPDQGFRAAAARNLGVLATSGQYVIFLDGDCVVRTGFVAWHRCLAETGYFVTGSRVLLDASYTQKLTVRGQYQVLQNGSLWDWLKLRLTGHSNKLLPLIGIPGQWWRHYKKPNWRRIKSCNLAVWRDDLFKVNGFDEQFIGWGHEDADLAIRLGNVGVKRKSGAFATEIFHLWHQENNRSTERVNYERVQQRLANGTTRAVQGLAEHSASSPP